MRLHLLACSLFAAASAFATTIDVKPGTSVATLLAARDSARQARAAGDKDPIIVRFSDGVYPLLEPVVFGPQDGDVTYEAAPGAKPVFVGGQRITGFKVGADGVWTVHLPEVAAGKSYFEALWVNGNRATRARTPNEGFVQAVSQPTEPLPGIPFNGDATHTLLQIAPEDAAKLRGLTPEQLRDVNVLAYHSWDVNRHRIAGVRFEDGVLQFTGGGAQAFFQPEPYQRLQFENFRGAMDAPGEWFLGRDGTLSYIPRPGETPDTAEVWAPVASRWLVFEGHADKQQFVEKITFRGLAFRFQGYTLDEKGAFFGQAESRLGAAIEADGARAVTFEKCEFAHTGSNAAWFHRGCHDIVVRECWMHDLGAGGVKIGDPGVSDSGPQQTTHVTVENSIIHSGGRYFPGAIGVTIFHATDCTLRHCDIADFFYTAVSIGWTWGYNATACGRNVVENCHLHHLGWGVLSDMGAVYTLGPQPGTVIRGCHIHDIGVSSYGGWGMYNDEGSTGIVWENNLVHHTQDAGYHQHYGRGNIVRNNIIAFCAEEHVRRSRPEESLAFSFERNIVLLGEGKIFAHVNKNWHDGRVALHDNLYWKPGGTIRDFAGKTWEEWQATGQDTGSLIADPLFKDAANGDWTLSPDSLALKLGFVPFDWRKAGVEGSEAWRKLAAREFPAMKYGTKPKAPPLALHDGFETTAAGAKPLKASAGAKTRIAVVEANSSAGKHCLELTDTPDTEPSFDPHFYYSPGHEQGTTKLAFDVRLEPAHQLLVEWRDDAEPYHTGPALTFQNGAVHANGRKLTEIPANTWAHVEMAAKLGDQSDATWNCNVTVPDMEPQRFGELKFASPSMKRLNWLGFISPGKAQSKCWLDEVIIENMPEGL
ncbi:right-handed parallel beta-helix repeat-containing protein [Verrucomicrobiota bacterium sgz303538]